MAQFIPVEGDIQEIKIEGSDIEINQQMHKYITGYLEAGELGEGKVMYWDEHFYVHQLPANWRATAIYIRACQKMGKRPPTYPIGGPVVIATLEETGDLEEQI